MPFEFIDNNATIDRALRRRIRSHVAKGKNIGRKVVRPSKIRAFERKAETTTALSHVTKSSEEAHQLESNKWVDREIERQVGDGLPVGLSLKQTPESRGLFLRGMFTYRRTEFKIHHSLP
jgi:hypothetical protein